MQSYKFTVAPCPHCEGHGSIVDGHLNDPYAREYTCLLCDGSGEWRTDCGECGVTEPVNSDRTCRDCDHSEWLNCRADHQMDQEREYAHD